MRCAGDIALLGLSDCEKKSYGILSCGVDSYNCIEMILFPPTVQRVDGFQLRLMHCTTYYILFAVMLIQLISILFGLR